MSKQSEAKEKQGYTRIKNCGNCSHFTCDVEKSGWNSQYMTEKNLRCGVGGFKVHKTAVCDIHVLRDPTNG
jgi:hypothetical protein